MSKKTFLGLLLGFFTIGSFSSGLSEATAEVVKPDFPKKVIVVYRPHGGDIPSRLAPGPIAAYQAMNEYFSGAGLFTATPDATVFEAMKKKDVPLLFSPSSGLVILYNIPQDPLNAVGTIGVARVDARVRVEVRFGAQVLASGVFKGFVNVNLSRAGEGKEGVRDILSIGFQTAVAKAARRAAEASLKKAQERFRSEFLEYQPTPTPKPAPIEMKSDSGLGSGKAPGASMPPVRRIEKWALVVGCGAFGAEPIAPRPEAAAISKTVFSAILAGHRVGKDHAFLLVDDQATRRSVQAKLDLIASRAAPGDQVMIFISGRGVPVNNAPGSIAYVLLHDSEMASLDQTALNVFDPQRNFLTGLQEQKVLVFLDTNFSAAAVPGIDNLVIIGSDNPIQVTLGFDRSVAQRILPKNAIFVASRPDVGSSKSFGAKLPDMIKSNGESLPVPDFVKRLQTSVPGGVVVAQTDVSGLRL